MKFLKSFILLLTLVGGHWAAYAEEETASDPESIDRDIDQFQDKNLIQEEEEQLRMERNDQGFDAFGEDEFNKNDDPDAYDEEYDY